MQSSMMPKPMTGEHITFTILNTILHHLCVSVVRHNHAEKDACSGPDANVMHTIFIPVYQGSCPSESPLRCCNVSSWCSERCPLSSALQQLIQPPNQITCVNQSANQTATPRQQPTYPPWVRPWAVPMDLRHFHSCCGWSSSGQWLMSALDMMPSQNYALSQWPAAYICYINGSTMLSNSARCHLFMRCIACDAPDMAWSAKAKTDIGVASYSNILPTGPPL